MQFKRNRTVRFIVHHNAFAHGLPPQQLPWSAFLAAGNHAFYAEAAGGRFPGEVSEHFIGDADFPEAVFLFYHKRMTSFCVLVLQVIINYLQENHKT